MNPFPLSVSSLVIWIGQALCNASRELRALAALLSLFHLHKHPALCPINSHKQVASQDLVSHLRQILDAHVHEARHIAFKGLVNQR